MNHSFSFNSKMDLGSTFIKLAVITDDEFGFLLAAEYRRANNVKYNGITFNFEKVEAPHYKTNFRFSKEDILRLKAALRIPEIIKVANGSEFSGLECMPG